MVLRFTVAAGAVQPQGVLGKHGPTHRIHGCILIIWEESYRSSKVTSFLSHCLSEKVETHHTFFLLGLLPVSSYKLLEPPTVVFNFYIMLKILIVILEFMPWYSQNQILMVNSRVEWKSVIQMQILTNALDILLIANSGSLLVLEEAAPLNLSNPTVGIWKTLQQISAQ